jgi:phage FluMu protein Com
MPASVRCSACKGTCVIEESQLGGKVKCPRCGGVFVATADSPPERPARATGPARAPSHRFDDRRRRQRFGILKALVLTLLAAGALAAVAWQARDKGFFEKFASGSRGEKEPAPERGLGPGFHIMPDEYWQVFEDPKKAAKPSGKAAPEAAPVAGQAVDAEGLVVHPVKAQGPYYLVNEMGGLVPSAVGVWVSPNRLGQGKEAFYMEPGEEVTVTHWVCNFGGFKVFRILNTKKRPGPRGKVFEAGWILGLYLQDKDGVPIR